MIEKAFEICTALLHDAVEDSDYTLEDLKNADLCHNSDTKRKPVVTAKDKKRLQKYKIALAILEDDYYDAYLEHYRKRIPLDDRSLYFLSVFYKQDGTVEKYSLDVEAASDTHIEFTAGGEKNILKELKSDASLPEALAGFMRDHSERSFMNLLDRCGIRYEEFRYD